MQSLEKKLLRFDAPFKINAGKREARKIRDEKKKKRGKNRALRDLNK